jgi:hypothetical protein
MLLTQTLSLRVRPAKRSTKLFDIICDLQRNPVAKSASKPFHWRTKMIG